MDVHPQPRASASPLHSCWWPGWLPAGEWTRALRSTDWGKLCWSWSFIPACSTQQHSHHPSLVTHLHISTSAGVPDPGWRHVTNGGSPRGKITITDTLPLPLPLLYPLIIRLRREGGKGVKIKNSDACKIQADLLNLENIIFGRCAVMSWIKFRNELVPLCHHLPQSLQP